VGEFIPALAAQPAYRQLKIFEQVEGHGMNLAFRKTAGAVALEPPFAPMPD
jgi:hypothetical protein